MAKSTHDLTRPPLAGGEIWTAAMEAAGWRCECTGECGRQHVQTGHRCPVEHGPAHRLMVAATDRTTSPAGAVDASQSVWCSACYDAATRLARAASEAVRAATQPDLFGVGLGGDAA